jgi:transcription elongation GreA/GreB family factor
MSKAFTKEDDDAGFSAPPSSSAIPTTPFRITRTGARRLANATDANVRAALARAEVLPPQLDPDRAALGVTVVVRTDDDAERRYFLVTPEELLLVGDGDEARRAASIQSPLGRALLGARVGDVRELRAPRGREELEVIALEGEEREDPD